MLQHKVALLYHHFSPFLSQCAIRPRDVDVVTSPLVGHRLRVRFGIRRFPKLGLHYAEFANGVRLQLRLASCRLSAPLVRGFTQRFGVFVSAGANEASDELSRSVLGDSQGHDVID